MSGHDNRRQLARLERRVTIDRCDDWAGDGPFGPTVKYRCIRDMGHNGDHSCDFVRFGEEELFRNAHYRAGYKHGFEAAKKEDPRSALRSEERTDSEMCPLCLAEGEPHKPWCSA